MDAGAGGCQSRSPSAHLLINPAAHPPRSPFIARLPHRLGCSFSSSSWRRDRIFFFLWGGGGVCVCAVQRLSLSARPVARPACRHHSGLSFRVLGKWFRSQTCISGGQNHHFFFCFFTLSNLTSLFGRRGPSLRVHVAVGARMHF